ncbi:MAG: flippase [Candidatus Kuenenbacteria bacterium]
MQSAEQKTDNIARNTTYYTSALIVQKILAFIYFSLIARFMGVEDTGKYTFALSFTTLFAIFIDLGLASVLTREIAKTKEKTQEYLSNILALKIPFSCVVYLLVVGMINILGYPSITKQLVYISGVIMFLDSFTLSFWAVMRGHQQLKFESIGVVGLQLITVVLGGLALFLGLGLKFLILALLCGSIFSFVLSAVTLKRKLNLSITARYNPQVLKFLFKIGVPFALMGIFSRVYTTLDTVLLSTLAGDIYVGWYSIPVKITLALQFLPMAFMAALFPAMSEYFVSNKEKLKHTFEKAMDYLMIIGLPLSVGIIIIAKPVILAVYTESYFNSILPLRILMISLFFLFINFPVGYLLNACNKQVTNTINMGAAVLVSVVLNIVLIPKYAHVGAAIASLSSTLVLFSLGMYWVPKIVNYSKSYLLKNFIKILLSSAAMGIALYFLGPFMHFAWLILAGVIIYFSVLFALGGVRKQDAIDVWKSIARG